LLRIGRIGAHLHAGAWLEASRLGFGNLFSGQQATRFPNAKLLESNSMLSMTDR
jgi:hypothetical protein